MQFYCIDDFMKKDFIVEIASSLLILLFTYAGLSKILQHDTFVFQMRLSHVLVMKALAGFLSVFIPIVELGIVVLLLLPKTRRKGLLSSLILLVAFSLYISIMLLSGMKLPCTCGGIISKLSWKGHLAFNLFFILISLFALLRSKKVSRSSDTSSTGINFSRV